MLSGIVFDIKRYAIHDGPGIRTTVFLKGCPLSCLWCHNPGSWEEAPQPSLRVKRCQGCGQCILATTGSICPVSRCAKRLFNGPCGGSTDGRCEINAEVDCAWQLIVDRLKALDRLDEYETLCPLKDWSSDRAGGPRKVVREDVQQ